MEQHLHHPIRNFHSLPIVPCIRARKHHLGEPNKRPPNRQMVTIGKSCHDSPSQNLLLLGMPWRPIPHGIPFSGTSITIQSGPRNGIPAWTPLRYDTPVDCRGDARKHPISAYPTGVHPRQRGRLRWAPHPNTLIPDTAHTWVLIGTRATGTMGTDSDGIRPQQLRRPILHHDSPRPNPIRLISPCHRSLSNR